MPLALLLDENISPVVAVQLARKRPDIPVQSLHTWREGALVGAPDADVLLAAYEEGWTLVTYDTQILSDLAVLFETGVPFSGLIVVDDKTIPSNNFGALMRSLVYLWDHEHTADWSQRLLFLPSA